MNNSKVLPILKALSRTDFLGFGRYLHSEFFTRDQQVLMLYEYLRRNSRDWNPRRLNKSYILKRISSKDKEYTIQQLNYIISDLYLQLKDYLIWKQTTQDAAAQNQLLLNAYKSLNLNKEYFNLSKKIEKALDKRLFQDADFYHQKMELYHQRYYYPNQLRLNVEEDHLLESDESFRIVLRHIIASILY